MTAPKGDDQQGAVDALQKELEANPFNTSLLSKLAETYANRGDYNNACQLYEKLVRLDEDNGRAWTALGHCYLLKAEYQKCFTAYQKALYTLPHTRDPQLWYGIALLYNKFDTYEYAEPAYQAVLRIDPNFEQKNEVFFKLGQIYKKTGAFDNAVSYLKNSIVGDNVPLNRKVDALCSIGVCYEKQGKGPNAVEIYREALELESGNFKTMEYVGWALAQQSQEAEAAEQLIQALDAVGNSSAEEGDIHYLLGRCYLLQKKFAEGQTEFQKAIFKNPNSYIYWCSIGVLYAKAAQPQDAFECFIKASNITQEESESWFNMGILYEHCNQPSEATLAYQRAATIDPKNTEAAKRKDDLSDRSRGPPPDYVHPKFEIGELPFSLQKSERAKKTNQLPGIEQHKPAEPAPASAPLTETMAAGPSQASSQPAPPPIRQTSSPISSAIPHVVTATNTPPRSQEQVKTETFPGLSFAAANETPPADAPPAVDPGQVQQSASYPGLPANFQGQMAGMMAGQFPHPGMNKPGMMTPMSPQMSMSPQYGMSPQMAMMGFPAQMMSAAQMQMPPQMSPQMAMNPQMNPQMVAQMAPQMSPQMSPQSSMSPQMPAGCMGMPTTQPGFNPMAFSGMMNPMGMQQMNPFQSMNPMMMSQMMQMMYMQQVAMMRSMFGAGRGGAPPPRQEQPEQQNSGNSESVETRSQKRKGDNLPDTRTKRRNG